MTNAANTVSYSCIVCKLTVKVNSRTGRIAKHGHRHGAGCGGGGCPTSGYKPSYLSTENLPALRDVAKVYVGERAIVAVLEANSL